MNAVPFKGLSVLIVDDCADAADSLAILVRTWGYRASVAGCGEEALQLASEVRPDVAFLDLAMPGMSGLELARRLRKVPGLANIYLVVISGWARPCDDARSREAGCDLFFAKPADPKAIQHILSTRYEELSRHDP
jgi:CheY-like chemotaxis protein